KLGDFPKVVAYQRTLLNAVQSVPGVESAGYINHIPLRVKGDISSVGAEGHDVKTTFQCNMRVVGPGYFDTMGIPTRRGRGIQETDVQGAPLVAVINETTARMMWPNSDPIGRHLSFNDNKIRVPVVGVVGDIHQ